ncbi:hypothetical protein [Mesorhizobium comanense]|jgi:hypothetical protein|uniref:hypothetical protein n=1 Tax=Mesorhizobium comanense TaxID=2502215 RepID=UPI0010F453A0|nr:hypothetical protein [Mesorhizobium comanense]
MMKESRQARGAISKMVTGFAFDRAPIMKWEQTAGASTMGSRMAQPSRPATEITPGALTPGALQ